MTESLENFDYSVVDSFSHIENPDVIWIEASHGSQEEYEISVAGDPVQLFNVIVTPFLENTLLKESLNNLWHAYQYLQEYNSYLLKLYSEEEFLEKAQLYARGFKEVPPDQLIYASNLILNTLDCSLTSAELSVLLNVDHNDIESNCTELIEHTPEESHQNNNA